MVNEDYLALFQNNLCFHAKFTNSDSIGVNVKDFFMQKMTLDNKRIGNDLKIIAYRG